MISTKKGFTLIELLIVISIIAILSGIILASLSSARSKAVDGKVKDSLTSLRNAAEIYYYQNGNKYQTTGSAITACPFATSTADFLADITSVNGSGYPIVNSLESAVGIVSPAPASLDCGASATGSAWSVAVILPSGAGSMCVDSTGALKSYSATEAEGHAGDPHGTTLGQTVCN